MQMPSSLVGNTAEIYYFYHFSPRKVKRNTLKSGLKI